MLYRICLHNRALDMRLTRMLAIWTLKSVLVMAPSHKDGGVGLRRDKIKSKVSKTKFTHARTNARTHTHTHTHRGAYQRTLPYSKKSCPIRAQRFMAHATRSLLITLSKAHVCLEKFVQIQLSMYTPVTLRSQTLLSTPCWQTLARLQASPRRSCSLQGSEA